MPSKKNRTKAYAKEIEYEDAPSGYVTFYRYKEPLQKFEGGYGFLGALLFDGKTDKVQCHLCGKWLEMLNSQHLRLNHGLNAAEYKELAGLLPGTALISEKLREKLIAKGTERFKNLKSRKGKKMSEETKRKIRATLKQNRSELQNLNGTCPLQILERLRKQAEELGRTPTASEIKGYETVVKVYGSVKKALKRAGLTPRKNGENVNYNAHPIKYDQAKCITALRDFYENEGRYPSASDCRRGMLPSFNVFSEHCGSFRRARKMAFPEAVFAQKISIEKPVKCHFCKDTFMVKKLKKNVLHKCGKKECLAAYAKKMYHARREAQKIPA